jgi:hypothetical protein
MFDNDCTNAWNKMREDKGGVWWMVVRVSEDGKAVKLIASGTDGFASFADCMKKQEPGMFAGVMRVSAVDNRGSVKSIRTKFVRVTVVSGEMPMAKRARAAQTKPEFDRFFSGTHLNLDTDVASRPLDQVAIAKSLLQIGGAHVPNGFDFSGGQEADESNFVRIEHGVAMPPQTVAKAPEPAPAAEAAPAAAAEAEAPKAEPQSPVKAVGDVTAMSPADAWSKVQSDNDPLNWVLFTYDGKNTSSASVFAGGANGLEELRSALDDERVLFGGVRVTGVDDRGSVKSVRAKLIFLQYTPSSVRPTVRAHAGTARGEFQKLLHGTHMSINIEHPGDINAKKIEDQLIQNGGAHKCGYYCFGSKITKPEQIPEGAGPQK